MGTHPHLEDSTAGFLGIAVSVSSLLGPVFASAKAVGESDVQILTFPVKPAVLNIRSVPVKTEAHGIEHIAEIYTKGAPVLVKTVAEPGIHKVHGIYIKLKVAICTPIESKELPIELFAQSKTVVGSEIPGCIFYIDAFDHDVLFGCCLLVGRQTLSDSPLCL